MKLFKGQTLIEVVLVIGLSAILLPALLTGFFASRNGTAQQEKRGYATALLKETEEAVKNIKNTNWANVSQNGIYHTSVSGNTWTLVSGSSNDSNGLTQSVTISDVYRDTSGAIVSSGGTIDASTKKVDIEIAWSLPSSSVVASTMYLTRTGNQTYTETTFSEFNLGTKTGTAIASSSANPTPTPGDGQVELAGGGGNGDWCAPNLSIAALDLPKNGVANAVSAIEGRVFAGTGDNASGVSFANVNISNANPPVASILGTFSNYKTNGIFGEANYAYIATDTNSKEIIILGLSSLPYTEVGSFDATGSADGDSVYVLGNRGYMTQGSNFRVFDLTSKTGSRPQIGPALSLAGTGTKVMVVGNYAYISISGSTTKLQIVDISDPTDPSKFQVVGQLTLPAGFADAKDLFVNISGSRTYLVTGLSALQAEFLIVNTSIKSLNLPVVSYYDTNGMDGRGITVVTNNKVILVGHGAEEYQAINVSNELFPSRCGGLNIDTGINGVSSVLEADGDAYSYIITGDATTELKIIEGGNGGAYSSSGTFESATYDAGSDVAFNRFTATVIQPVDTTIKMQVAAAPEVSGSCSGATFTFLGPNGTASDYFLASGGTISGTIPFDSPSGNYENPSRCFRYKTWFDTAAATQSPILYDVTINHSL